MKEKELYHMRKDYAPQPLTMEELSADPFLQFGRWFSDASQYETTEPNAMIVSTCGLNMLPSSRVVLLKKYSPEGFVFFTNYNSRKGNQLSQNPNASILFFWPETMRQVRIEGSTERTSERDSDEYFNSRPAESRATAMASRQSEPLENKEQFENEVEKILKYSEEDISAGSILARPLHWGGYILKPSLFEFWQGGTNRAHDRFEYRKESPDQPFWTITRLYP